MTGRNRTKAPSSQSMVGGISLLIIFSVLCMTVFALLSLSTVQVGTRLTDAELNAVTGYYRADAEAEQILARLRTGTVSDGVDAAEGGVYAYSVPVSETQELEVEVIVSGSTYQVLRWQLVPLTAWEPDTGIDLWDGQ